MTPAEERDRDTAIGRIAWGEIEHTRVGDVIHACVCLTVVPVIFASAIGLGATALGLW